MSYSQPPPNPDRQQPPGDGFGPPQPPDGSRPAPQPPYGSPLQSQGPRQGQGPPQPPQSPLPPGYGYGQPPAPPRGGRRGRRTGIIVAVLAVAGAAVFLMVRGNDGAAPSDGGRQYRLIVPATLATEYRKWDDGDADDDGFDDTDVALLEKLGMTTRHLVSADYLSGSATTGKLFSFTGAYGAIEDPQHVADGVMAETRTEATRNDNDSVNTELVGGVRTLHPAGADDAVVECQTEKITGRTPKPFNASVCLWVDSTTIGMIAPLDLAVLAAGGEGVSPQDTADLLAQVRKETRVEIT